MYTYQIRILEFIIDNWDKIRLNQERSDFYCYQLNGVTMRLSLSDGLCLNSGLYKIEPSIIFEIYDSFPKFSGDYDFPLRDYEDYFTITNFAYTPERLELAKHCLEFLKKLNNESKN